MTIKSYLSFTVTEGFSTIAPGLGGLTNQPLFKFEKGAVSMDELADLPLGTEVSMSYLIQSGRDAIRNERMFDRLFSMIDAEYKVDQVPPLPAELNAAPWNSPNASLVAVTYAQMASRVEGRRELIEKSLSKDIITEAAQRINEGNDLSAAPRM